MRSFYNLHGFLKRLAACTAVHDHQCPKFSTKSIHFLKPHKPNNRIPRKNTKNHPKSTSKQQPLDPKTYMRETITNIYKILKYSTWDSAKEQLQNLSIRWDSYTVSQVLKTHPPMEKSWLFFNWVAGFKGFKHDQFTYTTMLDIFGEARRVSSMTHVFKQMQEKGIKIDAVTYTSLMHWLSNAGDVDGAVQTWEEMRAQGCAPTVVSYTAYMKILFGDNRVKEATDVYREMIQCGCSPTCHTYTVLMDYLIGSGKCKEALDIFGKMQDAGVQPDKAACNILVQKLCKAGDTWTLNHILLFMKENRLALRYPVFLEAVGTFKIVGESDSLLRQVHPHFFVDSGNQEASEFRTPAADALVTIDEGLVLILLNKENLVAIDRLLAGNGEKKIRLDSAITSTIIEVNCGHCRLDGALLAFEYSMKMGIILERNAYLALVGALIRSKSFPKVVEIVVEMIRAGYSLGIYFSALLIHRLGRARRTPCAAKIFNLLPDDHRCTATYTALIGAYFSAGSADKGLQIFEAMRGEGFRPFLGTYNVLLAGLQKCGRVREAEMYRKEKKSLQADGEFQDAVPVEQKICDFLFAGDVVS
ncbi:pentatricopeptide repeat-containing protein At2g01390 [Malus sylvestris]|uniref:pentatricopeptide repeat-containing protein At2g01390 n=1 Tax=Malus sylvestris TaxID=3752 RepID=UPI0021AC570B|nr:pentatricopeptide repeat-containing protein At2g01390 [Malus sylvestris]